MYVWMDGWMDGCMDGWMDGWMDAWMDRWMDVIQYTFSLVKFHEESKNPIKNASF